VEKIRSARRYLRAIGYKKDFDAEVMFLEIEKNQKTNFKPIIDKIIKGKSVGVLSEAGCPGIADPGTDFVNIAHRHDIEVIPLSGPSSFLMAIMASGLNGQGFCFHGYMPIEKNEKLKKLQEIQSLAFKTKQTQVFMETPYRNNALVQDICSSCDSKLSLTIAKNITDPEMSIKTKTLQEWKKGIPDLHKIPAVFCLNYNL
jgi:16S rRNA (cytidine1402-2'-O)-methyltransferase